VPLTLHKVSYRYDQAGTVSLDAIRDVDLSVAVGEVVLVLGATGSGKSTLMRVAAGLLVPSAGSATIDGEGLTPQSARGRVGLVFQDAESQLFADTLAADVEFGPRNLGASRLVAARTAAEALDAVGLPSVTFADRSPFSLSGGEARRAAIAGVLAMNPDYLLFDEPTAGLDAPGRDAVRRLIDSARRRCGIVVVTHAAEEFLEMADRVHILDGGRVSWEGAAVDLLAEPQHFTDAALGMPDLLEFQVLARDAGVLEGGFSLDPDRVAAAVQAARGCAG
jgi:energy-coupling factor transport system ATP-binding protein